MKYYFLVLGLLIIAILVYQAARVHRLSLVSRNLVKNTLAFSSPSKESNLRFLIIGDSLGVGVGVTSSEYSIAGRLSHDYPQAEIRNVSVSGLRIKDGLAIAKSLKQVDLFDIIFIQLGANDILHLTSKKEAEVDLQNLFSVAKSHSKKVIYFNSGSLGSAPIFPFPIDYFYHRRSTYFYKRLQDVAKESGVRYVDLYYPRSEDPFLKNPTMYYAADLFHVSDAAYGLWYEKISKEL